MAIQFKTGRMHRRILYSLIGLEVVSVVIPVVVLGAYFNFPDILRAPAAQAFPLFRTHQSVIVPAYYLFVISGLLYIPLSYFFLLVVNAENPTPLPHFLMAMGVATALFQTIGFSRWLFLMPFLTDSYFQHPENQIGISLMYEIFNRYVGMTVGEHLGFIAMVGWTLTLTFLHPWNRYVKVCGILVSVLLLISTFEHFGGEYAAFFGFLNFVANASWTCWLVALGVLLSVKAQKDAQQTHLQVVTG